FSAAQTLRPEHAARGPQDHFQPALQTHMNNETQSHPVVLPSPKDVSIKVFGIGNAGRNVIEPMIRGGLPASAFIAVTADPQARVAPGPAEILHLETARLRGLGTGGDPERGRAAAEENVARLKAACQGVQVIFIVA